MASSAPAITIAIASLNTRRFTELAVRTAVRRAGRPVDVVVGDSGSVDGTLAMLDRLGSRYVQRVEMAPEGRTHAEWLDHWVATLDTELAVFADSDVEFRRQGWLLDLMAVREQTKAAIVTSEWIPEFREYVEPFESRTIRLMDRPAPWLQLVHLPTLRSLGCSYAFRSEPAPDIPEGVRAYDVGAWIARVAEARGHAIVVMPPSFREKYHHYGGRSWRAQKGASNRADRVAAIRLARFRMLRW